MSRFNNIFSVITIVLFVTMMAVPLLNAAECKMDCCTVETPTHCEIEMEDETCCPSIAECSDVIFIPIVTAPILKVNVEKDITAEYLSSMIIILSYENIYPVQLTYIKIDISVPPGFQTPLLV